MENDMISRSALLEALNELYMAALRKTVHSVETVYELDHFCMLVKEAPSVFVGDVVLCMECKHWHENQSMLVNCGHCDELNRYTCAGNFCSWSKRKMDAEVQDD